MTTITRVPSRLAVLRSWRLCLSQRSARSGGPSAELAKLIELHRAALDAFHPAIDKEQEALRKASQPWTLGSIATSVFAKARKRVAVS
jgi:hypothetical protein